MRNKLLLLHFFSTFLNPQRATLTYSALAAFRGEGQIIAHFLWRSYDLHIYYGIFCTGCSVGGQQRPISPQVWTKAWQRYFQCRQCSLLSSLVIQIPMVTAMGGWVNNLGLFPIKQIGGWDVFAHTKTTPGGSINKKYAASLKAQVS